LPVVELRAFWCKVGALAALDVLINNMDRVPLLWDNEGNTGNLMVVVDQQNGDVVSSVVGIDQAVTAIVDTFVPGRRRYLDRVSKLAFAIFCGSWEIDALSPERAAANEVADKAAADRVAAEKAAGEKLAAEMAALKKAAAEKAAAEQAVAEEVATANLSNALAGEDLSALHVAINEAWAVWIDTEAAEEELARRVAAADQAAAELAVAEKRAVELVAKLAAAALSNVAPEADAQVESKPISNKGKGKMKGPPLPVKVLEQGKGKGPPLPAKVAKGKANVGFVFSRSRDLLSKGSGKKGKGKSKHGALQQEEKPSQARSPPPAPPWCPSMGLKRVQEAFEVNCSIEVDAQAFMEGLRDGLGLIADRWEDGSMHTFLDAIVAGARQTFQGASVNVGLNEVETMSEFVSSVATVVAEGRIASGSSAT